MRCSGNNYSLGVMLENQKDMLIYHGKTVVGTTHSFSSKWYEWIVMKRPIWFYSADYPNDLKGGISSFGNPMLWWGGIFALAANFLYAAKYKDKTALFLLIAYISQMFFWIPIERTTYIYHYFPMVIFLCLMLCNCIKHNCTYYGSKFIRFWYGYAAVAVILFCMFYPVLSGIPVHESYVDHFLRWFSTWVLI